MNNAQSRQQNRSTDKLQPIREVFETWDSHLQDFYTSGPSITVEKQLVCFRGGALSSSIFLQSQANTE